MQRLLLGLILLPLIAACPGPVRAQAVLACDTPEDLTTPADPLPHVAAALGKNSLDILALGSGSTVGDAGGSTGAAFAFRAPGASYPYKMLEALQAMRPGKRFQLTVKGGRSMTADSMLPMLQEELAAKHYDLVLWQTGTVEAVHGLRPESLRNVLMEGVEAVAKTQTDLVLIDPQFSRFLRANADLSPYETVLQQVAGNPGVTLFHRMDLTQTWVGNGQIDLERVGKDQRDKTIGLLNTCLGQALARFVLTGATER